MLPRRMTPAHKQDFPTRRLVLHNIFSYGHFLVYASVFTRWALSRGFEVHMLGRGLDRSPYGRRFGETPGVVLHDAAPGERFSPGQAQWARRGLLAEGLDTVLEAQRTLKPDATILLTTDDLLFERVGVTDEAFRFVTPTFGLLTFGNRERYTAYSDAYAAQVRTMLERRRPFQGLFTLDEHHVRDAGADPDYLVFLPDIFAEDEPAASFAPAATRIGRELAEFLDRGTGPVFPVLGKVDQRKNARMVLELAASLPEASVVALGERVPCQEDARIDALLETLRRGGRLFASWGFVPEELFHRTLAHERTRLLPLPYSCHHGSSGIQLLGVRHGKPCVVPSNGLMARRVIGHELGAVFNPGDERDFRRACREVLDRDPSVFKGACARFMKFFGERARGFQIARALGLERGQPVEAALNSTGVPPSLSRELVRQASGWILASRWSDALRALDQALAVAPDDPLALFRKALALWASDRPGQASRVLERLAGRASLEEFDCLVRLAASNVLDTLAQDPAQAARTIMDLLRLAPADAARPALSPFAWREAGLVLARTGAHAEAADCFRKALALDAAWHDCRLNLSDVLRYAGRHAESLAELDALEKAAPHWPGLSHKRGQAFFEKGELERALACFLAEPAGSPHYEPARQYIERLAGVTET